MTGKRIVFITGASRGIGAAIAKGLSLRGYNLALNDIEKQKDFLEETAETCRKNGAEVITVYGDVSDKSSVEQMAKIVLHEYGYVDAIVNNAGILIAGECDGLAEKTWDAVMNVNAKGSFMVTQAFLPSMKARQYGRIVNVASIGGKHGAPEQAHYSASKAAVMGYSRVLAQEVGAAGITVNSVCPGIILTDMGRVNLDDPAVRKTWEDKTAMARIGAPEDVVGAVAFFASDDAAFITGQSLNVDGGIVFS